jgi:hypothetical protein
MRTDLRSPKLTKAIRHAIREARLAYEFCPGSYSMGALNAVLAVEQVYLRDQLDQYDTTVTTRESE